MWNERYEGWDVAGSMLGSLGVVGWIVGLICLVVALAYPDFSGLAVLVGLPAFGLGTVLYRLGRWIFAVAAAGEPEG